MQSMERNQKGL